jgi:hypothetical protein
MIRSLVLVLATGCASLLTFVAPQNVMAQYGPYQPAPPYSPYQPPPYEAYQPGPTMQDLAGTWFMAGNEDEPCQVIPSRQGDRALFVNENGGRAEGFIRGNRIFVPAWKNLQGRIGGDMIRWSNKSVWTR